MDGVFFTAPPNKAMEFTSGSRWFKQNKGGELLSTSGAVKEKQLQGSPRQQHSGDKMQKEALGINPAKTSESVVCTKARH